MLYSPRACLGEAMSENHKIADDWDWFPPYKGTPLSSDEVIVMSGGIAHRALVSQLRQSDGRGWINISDSEHTAESPQEVEADQRALLTLDALGATTNYTYRDGLPVSAWSGNKFYAQETGETYLLRPSFVVVPATGASDNHMDIELDIGSPIGTIFQTMVTLAKGTPSRFSFAMPTFALETFFANGAEIYVTPNVDCEIYGKALLIQRMSRP